MADSLNKKKATRPEGENDFTDRNESVTISDIEKLFSLMRENEIAELEIEQNKTKIHIVSKGAPAIQQQPMMHYMPSGMQHMQMMPQSQGGHEHQQPQAPPPLPSQSGAAKQSQPTDADDGTDSLPSNARTVLSPMVGTFYRSPGPESPMFVNEGDVVNEETVLCIIEAMKLMNEIKAEKRGKILRVLVEDGMPVEFNQPLFVLE